VLRCLRRLRFRPLDYRLRLLGCAIVGEKYITQLTTSIMHPTPARAMTKMASGQIGVRKSFDAGSVGAVRRTMGTAVGRSQGRLQKADFEKEVGSMKKRAVGPVVVAIVSLLGAGGCQDPPEPEPVMEQEPAPPPPEPEPVEAPEPEPPPKPAAKPVEGALGTPKWVEPKGNGWIMIQGVDGGTYENYYPSVVKNVQTALQTEGLYDGPISGVLDERTSNSLAEYQKANNLRASGVPTPRTREALKIPPQVPE